MHTVIIVDDNPWAHEDIRQTFQFEAYAFTVTGDYYSAEEAVTAILQDPPDLIITDIRMEKLSGLDLSRICRDHGIDSLIVLVSGYERFDYAQLALRWDVFDYLLKPLDSDQVRGLMTRVVERLKKEEGVSPKYSNDSFGKALQYIDAHYASSLSLNEVAKKIHLNKNYLSELFSKRLGMTFTQYKNTLRIEHARELISKGDMNMTEIAMAVGFDSSSRFSKVFHQLVGMTPQQYRSQRSGDVD